jgi:hypothetical protein
MTGAFTFEQRPDTHRRTSDRPVIILLGLMVGKISSAAAAIFPGKRAREADDVYRLSNNTNAQLPRP